MQEVAFCKFLEKIEREIEQLELALEDLLVAMAEDDNVLLDEWPEEPPSEAFASRHRARVSNAFVFEQREIRS